VPIALGVLLYEFGIAGYRAGWVWSGLAVAVTPAVLAWRLLRLDRATKTIWVIAILVIGLTASAWLVDHAPLSTGQLAGRMKRLPPPFSTTISERRSGHSSCRPHCPRVTRVVKAPDTAPFAALFNTAAGLRVQGVISTLEPIGRKHPVRYLRVPSHRMVIDVRVAKADGYLRLTITLQATRRLVRHPGPVQSDTTINLSTR
jgi:hypothetical protein